MNPQNITLGDIVADIGCYPERLGVVVDIDDNFFTIRHMTDFLTFPEEHPFHFFAFDDDEFIPMGTIGSNNLITKRFIEEYQLSLSGVA